MVDLVVTVASVLQLILDAAGVMGSLRVLRAFQPLKVVTASPSLREVRSRSRPRSLIMVITSLIDMDTG